MLQRYNSKALSLFDGLDEFGAVYQVEFVKRAINRQPNQDLDKIKDAVISEFNSRFTISGKLQINDSLKKMHKLYGDDAADEFIGIYNVVGDELNIEQLEADIKGKHQNASLTEDEQDVSKLNVCNVNIERAEKSEVDSTDESRPDLINERVSATGYMSSGEYDGGKMSAVSLVKVILVISILVSVLLFSIDFILA